MQGLERLLTVEDVCDLFRFKKSYVYHLTHRGEIPHLKIGNHVRFRLSQVEAWLTEQTVTPSLAEHETSRIAVFRRARS